ncbi:MAG: GGDEF domain-containing protein [Nocardioides sp.]|uniref:GGDEF domain-containing protein n=1 Tax=Nocardioides sp. TaxID=35761 RepID=UPI0039E23D30
MMTPANRRRWHDRGAVGLGVISTVCLLAAFTTHEITPAVMGYYAASLATIAAVWALLHLRLERPALLAWPVLDMLGVMGASVVAPHAASLTTSAVLMGFLYTGMTQRRGVSLALLPLAIPAFVMAVDLSGADLAVRLPLAVIVWLAVSELPSWLLHNLAAAQRRVEELAATDGLTGLANRRRWETRLSELAASREPFAVLLIDLDHFKAFNDQHGHIAGDALLARFADQLVRAVGAGHVVARWGGEEFTIALLGYDQDSTELIARRILTVVPDRQTCSIGVAVLRPGETPLELMTRADAALYAAKSAGRAQHSVAS